MMRPELFFLIGLMIMLSSLMLTQTHIVNLIKLLIGQNILLVIYLLLKAIEFPSTELIITLAFTFLIKVIILPYLLWRMIKFLSLAEKIEPLFNRSTLLLTGIVLVIFACILSHQIESVIGKAAIIGFSLSLANAFLAVLLIIFRRKAISQVIGLLVMENSIFLFSATLTQGFPWLIELGMGFDVLIGFMIFALFLLRIRSTYGSLEINHLEKLRERV